MIGYNLIEYRKEFLGMCLDCNFLLGTLTDGVIACEIIDTNIDYIEVVGIVEYELSLNDLMNKNVLVSFPDEIEFNGDIIKIYKEDIDFIYHQFGLNKFFNFIKDKSKIRVYGAVIEALNLGKERKKEIYSFFKENRDLDNKIISDLSDCNKYMQRVNRANKITLSL